MTEAVNQAHQDAANKLESERTAWAKMNEKLEIELQDVRSKLSSIDRSVYFCNDNDNDNEMTMTMKNIYLTINQQIAKYSSKLLLL